MLHKKVTITSAFITFSLVEDSWKSFETEGWLVTVLSNLVCVCCTVILNIL